MVCTSLRSFVYNIVHYPLRKCVFSSWTCPSLWPKPQKKNGMNIDPTQENKITREYAIIVHLPYPSLLGCGDQQETAEHCRSTTLDT